MDRRKFLTGSAAIMGGALVPSFGLSAPVFAAPTKSPRKPRPTATPTPEPSPTGGQLAAGLRARRDGPVGYLGNAGDLTTLSYGGSSPAGTVWAYGNTLIVNTNNTVIDHCRIPYHVDIEASNVKFTNCVIGGADVDLGGIMVQSGSGTITVEDSTIRVDAAAEGGGIGNAGGTCVWQMRRCEAYNSSDFFQPNLVPGSTPVLLSQCYIHDLAKVNAGQHLDGVQPFQSGNTGSPACPVTIEHSWIDPIGSGSTAIVYPNSACTFGTDQNTQDQMDPLVVNNNYLSGGSYILRLYGNTNNVTMTNNDFGTFVFDNYVSDTFVGTITSWSNNKDSGGNTIPPP